MDAQLERFVSTVMDRSSLAYDRNASTIAENQRIDEDVMYLCICLVPHFLSQAATAVLEYLVRKYRCDYHHTLAIIAGSPRPRIDTSVRLSRYEAVVSSCWRLVHGCRVHECNATKLLACFAPYHATPEFARLVQISVIRGTAFEFLDGTKQTGAVVPRTAIVKRCLKDHVRFCSTALVCAFLPQRFRREAVEAPSAMS